MSTNPSSTPRLTVLASRGLGMNHATSVATGRIRIPNHATAIASAKA